MKTLEDQAHRAAIRSFDTHAPLSEVMPAEARHVAGQAAMQNPSIVQLVALFNQLDERGQKTTLAMLAVAVKLHPKEK